jgi:hypothetical protein
MLSLLLLLPLAVCNSTFTCAVACEKNDVAACTWLARELSDLHAAAKACALDDTSCDDLARLLIASGRDHDVSEAAARLAPKCEKGDMATCELIVTRAWDMGRGTSRPFAVSTRAATQAYCSGAVPSLCSDNERLCDDWDKPLKLCAAAAAGLHEPKLLDGVWTRALAACRKSPNACVDLLFRAQERVHAATTTQLKAQESKLFGELVQTALPACRKPDDRACTSLRTLDLDNLPSLAAMVATKRCAVEGGRVCSEQHERLCNGGKGPLTSCVDAVLALGSDSFDPTAGVSKKLVEACIKDDARACFAAGVMSAGQRFMLRDSLLTSDEAFAKSCKLKHMAGCRASVKPQAIVEPRTIPSDAVHPNEQVSVHVRAKGDGSAIGAVYLVEEWTWNIGGDGEAEHERSVVATIEDAYRRERLELAGLKEGADVIVWDNAAGTIKRTVVLANVAP